MWMVTTTTSQNITFHSWKIFINQPYNILACVTEGLVGLKRGSLRWSNIQNQVSAILSMKTTWTFPDILHPNYLCIQHFHTLWEKNRCRRIIQRIMKLKHHFWIILKLILCINSTECLSGWRHWSFRANEKVAFIFVRTFALMSGR